MFGLHAHYSLSINILFQRPSNLDVDFFPISLYTYADNDLSGQVVWADGTDGETFIKHEHSVADHVGHCADASIWECIFLPKDPFIT